MRRTVSSAAVLAALSVTAFAVAPLAAELPEQRAAFTADSFLEIGGDRIEAKVYHDRGLERQEMSVDGLAQITILRPDLDKAFILQPEIGSLIEVPIEEASLLPPRRLLREYGADCGDREEVAGEATSKCRVTSPKGSDQHLELVIWITDDGIAMRMEGEIEVEGSMESLSLTRKNLTRGTLDPVLFEPHARPGPL